MGHISKSDYHKACGERLRKLIQLLGMKFVDAAEIMGITKHVLNHWMKGNGSMDPYGIFRLCQARNVNFDYIFLGIWERLPFDIAKALDVELANELPSKAKSMT